MQRLLTDYAKSVVRSLPGTLLLIVFRLCWIGVFAFIAVMFPIAGAIYLSSFSGLSLVVHLVILILLHVFAVIPSLVMGFLPTAVIDKKPKIVRFFYWITIPLLLGLLGLYSIDWHSADTQNTRHAVADTELLIAVIVGAIFIGGIGYLSHRLFDHRKSALDHK